MDDLASCRVHNCSSGWMNLIAEVTFVATQSVFVAAQLSKHQLLCIVIMACPQTHTRTDCMQLTDRSVHGHGNEELARSGGIIGLPTSVTTAVPAEPG
jgi:hypothetical protein